LPIRKILRRLDNTAIKGHRKIKNRRQNIKASGKSLKNGKMYTKNISDNGNQQ